MSGSLSVSAKPPRKATLYGALYGETTQAYQTLEIIPVSNNIFGLKPLQDLTTCQYLRLYFGMGVDSIQSFHIKLRRLSDWVDDPTPTLNSVAIDLCYFNDNGLQTGTTQIRTQVQTERSEGLDGFMMYEWTRMQKSLFLRH